MIHIWANTYYPQVNEIVTIIGDATPVEDIDIEIYSYDENKVVGIYTIFLKTLGIDHISIKPGLLGIKLQVRGLGVDSGEYAEFDITVKASPPPVDLTLSVNNNTPKPSEIVTFTITTVASVNYIADLKAYTEGHEVGLWNVPIMNGVGTAEIIPSIIGDALEWQAIIKVDGEPETYSNKVTTNIITDTTPPTSILLEASKLTPVNLENVKFTVTTDPEKDYVATLTATVEETPINVWNIPVTNGAGHITLVPSTYAPIIKWQVKILNILSNIVTTNVESAPGDYAVKVSVSEGGTTIPAPNTYQITGSFTVKANPYAGYVFDYWMINNVKQEANPITTNITQDTTILAVFKKKEVSTPQLLLPITLLIATGIGTYLLIK